MSFHKPPGKMFDDQCFGDLGSKIHISNLSDKILKYDLENRFNKYGKIIGLHMQGTTAQIMFEHEESAHQAVRHENMTQMKDCRIDVIFSNEKTSNNRMPNMGMGRGRSRSPSGDRFRDRGMAGGRGFRDEPLGRPGCDDNFHGMGPSRSGEGEPFPKHPRFDGPREPLMPPLGGPDPFHDFYKKDDFMMNPNVKVNDCEILVLNKLLQGYAELIEQRLKTIGLTVDLIFIRDEAGILRALNDVARRGTFYAVIISHQSELHGSLTLNILQGPTPQEHRNMPMDDALKLIARTFVQMRQEKRGLNSGQPPIDREIHFILNLLMNGKYLTIPELDRVIRYVQDIRDRQSIAEKIPVGTLGVQDTPGPVQSAKPPEGDNLSDQQNLQQRILNIISQTAPNMPATPAGQAASLESVIGMVSNTSKASGVMPPSSLPNSTSGGMTQSQAVTTPSSSNTYINFDNPSVQKALDSLMSSGPNILKNITMTGPGQQTPSGNSSNMSQPPNMPQNSMNPMNMNSQGNQNPVQGGGYRQPLMGAQVPPGNQSNYYNPRGGNTMRY